MTGFRAATDFDVNCERGSEAQLADNHSVEVKCGRSTDGKTLAAVLPRFEG